MVWFLRFRLTEVVHTWYCQLFELLVMCDSKSENYVHTVQQTPNTPNAIVYHEHKFYLQLHNWTIAIDTWTGCSLSLSPTLSFSLGLFSQCSMDNHANCTRLHVFLVTYIHTHTDIGTSSSTLTLSLTPAYIEVCAHCKTVNNTSLILRTHNK